jgi:hypothetical protein
MSLQTWSETLISAQVDGTAVNTTAAATSLFGTAAAAAKFTLPANFFSIGKVLRVTANGRISTTTGPPTITLDVRFGSTVVWNGAAVTTVASLTNKSWELMALLTCRAIGTSANLIGVGKFTSSIVVGSTGGNANTAVLPDSAPAVGSNFDSTLAQIVDLFATWSASSASNSIQLHGYTLEALN